MKKIKLLISCAVVAFFLVPNTGCQKEEKTHPQEQTPGAEVSVKTVISLDATEKVYINLSTGEQLSAANATASNWDICFYALDRTITVGVNSGTEGSGTAGAQIVESSFEDLLKAPASGYLNGKEATGDYLKWSSYTGSTTEPKHAVLPKPGLTIVVKGVNGNYTKIQMLSLYKGNPNHSSADFANLNTRPDFGYFSFRYATQTNGSANF